MSDNKKWSSASIVISSHSMTAHEIATLLKIEPTGFHEKGEPLNKRNPKSRKREEHLWRFESKLPPSESLEKHIENLIEILEIKAKGLNKVAERSSCEIFCGFSSGNGQGGFVLEHNLLERIGKLPVDLIVDLYPPEE